MRTLDVVLYVDETESVSERAAGKTVVVVDILRASTTIAVALANGAEGIVPVLTPEEARDRRTGRLAHALLGGEREGVRLDGFDLGNSPLEYTPERVRGKTILFTTTNGTRAIRAAATAERLFVGAFVNLDAVGAALEGDDLDVLIVCAGTERRFTLEDALFAGACVARLRDRFGERSDAAIAAEALWTRFRDDLPGALASCRHGGRLVRKGFADDVVFCATVGTADVLPRYADGSIRLA